MIFSSDTQRLVGWATGLRALREQPAWRWAFGWGPESFRAVYRLYRTQAAADFVGADHIADHAHSLPLELLLTLGVVGTAAFLYFAWALWQAADEEGRAAMLGLGVVALVEPVFFPPAALLFLLLGARREHYCFEFSRPPFWARVAAGVCLAGSAWLWARSGAPHGLTLHPRESEAVQFAIQDALREGRLLDAKFYARQVAKLDPKHRAMVAQSEALTRAIAARVR